MKISTRTLVLITLAAILFAIWLTRRDTPFEPDPWNAQGVEK